MTLHARRTGRSFASFGELVAVDVLEVQCGLWQLGFDPGRFDSFWGPMTEAALNRWYAWWRSRQADAPAPEYFPPPVNRAGLVRMPEQWAEIAAAALRGPCSREARGAHRAPPVPEPRPLTPPVVILAPDGVTQVVDAPIPVRESSSGVPWGWLLAGGALVAGLAYYGTRR